jgi:hypothetical protein
MDTCSKYSTIKEFSNAFLLKLDRLNRLGGVPWNLPEELLRMLYLNNLGDAFEAFRRDLCESFNVLGVDTQTTF